MLSFQRDQIPFLSFESLEGLDGVLNVVTTREGGVSPPPFASLNLGLGKDDPELVTGNIERVRRSLGLKKLIYLHQVHGTQVVPVSGGEDLPAAQADGLATDRPGVGLLIKQADCQAITLAAPGRAVANLHVGWRGNVANMPAKGVEFMSGQYGLAPGELYATISPSLGPCCAEFVNYRDELPEPFWAYQVSPEHFDLWRISRDQLIAAGVRPERIQISGLCTKCGRDFYSHRRGDLGRFGTVAALTNGDRP